MDGGWGTADGAGSAARFQYPTGVAVDGEGNVYVADPDNNTIRKVTPAGIVTTLGGMPRFGGGGYQDGGSTDGTGSAARFNHPSGIAVDDMGNIYVADVSNNTIRKGYPALVILHSGPGFGFNPDGSGFGFQFTGPVGQPVVVEASTDLMSWLPIWTNTFTGTLHFSDPQWTNHPARLYRLRSP